MHKHLVMIGSLKWSVRILKLTVKINDAVHYGDGQLQCESGEEQTRKRAVGNWPAL